MGFIKYTVSREILIKFQNVKKKKVSKIFPLVNNLQIGRTIAVSLSIAFVSISFEINKCVQASCNLIMRYEIRL